MANPSGANAKAGRALQQLVDASPMAGTNTLLVTHKTNITDAFGKEAADVQEGAAFFLQVGRVGRFELCCSHQGGRLARTSGQLTGYSRRSDTVCTS
jgi:hypothetical protein